MKLLAKENTQLDSNSLEYVECGGILWEKHPYYAVGDDGRRTYSVGVFNKESFSKPELIHYNPNKNYCSVQSSDGIVLFPCFNEETAVQIVKLFINGMGRKLAPANQVTWLSDKKN